MPSIKATTVGPQNLGVLLNFLLYGMLTCQYFSYLITDFNDAWWLKMLVFALCIMDTAHIIVFAYEAWDYGLQTFYDDSAIFDFWPYGFSCFLYSITAFLVQMFLTHRLYRLKHRAVWCVLIALFAAGTLGLGLNVSVKAVSLKSSAEFVRIEKITIHWFASEIAVDWTLAGFLTYFLARSRTGVRKSNQIVSRLIRAALQTGLLTGVFTSMSLVFYLRYPKTYYYSIFGIASGRVYSLTIMDTILVRYDLRKMLERGETPASAVWELKDLGSAPFPAHESTVRLSPTMSTSMEIDT